MKRLLLFAAAAVMSLATMAQTVYDFIPTQGSFATEIQFNPFSNNFETFKLDQIKLRYMITDLDAIRFGVGGGFDHGKYTPVPDSNSELYQKANAGFFNVNLGYERHFLQVSRIDLYAGAELGFEKTFSNSKTFTNGNVVSTTSDGDEDERVYTQYGCNLLTGIDFYVYRGLYIGAEFGLKFYIRDIPQYKYAYYDTNNELVEKKKGGETTIIHFGTYCVPALRIGWTF